MTTHASPVMKNGCRYGIHNYGEGKFAVVYWREGDNQSRPWTVLMPFDQAFRCYVFHLYEIGYNQADNLIE